MNEKAITHEVNNIAIIKGNHPPVNALSMM